MTERSELTEHDELALAIGRVAMQSAINDERLRWAITGLMSTSESVFLFVEGQSTDWLCETLPVVLSAENYEYQRWTPELHDRLLSAVKQVKALQQYRNIVVHSTWSKGVDPREADITQPRPWGQRDDARSWSARRSRYRTYAPESEWTVSDIHLLADKMAEAGKAVESAYFAMARVRRLGFATNDALNP